MEALDLTKHRPRSPWAQLDGLYMLPRTIDKLRALLPGGNPGPYNIAGFSQHLFNAVGVTEEAAREAVARAADDAEFAAWLRANGDASKYEAYNERFSNRRLADIEDKETFFGKYPQAREMPLDSRLFDMLDKDDDEIFAALST